MQTPSWQWWNAPEGDEMISEVVKSIHDEMMKARDERIDRLIAMRSVYLDIACERYENFGYFWNKRSKYNLTQGSVDSTHASIVASRPRPKVVTIAADDTASRRAELRQRWIDGEYERLGAYEKLSEMALDGLIYGTGVLKVGSEDGRPVIDRVWCGDLWLDPREERYGRVRTLYQAHALDRDIAMQEFPDHMDEIRDLPPLDLSDAHFPDIEVHGYECRNQVGIIEAWRLPSTAKPFKVVSNGHEIMLGAGRHVVICSGCVLVDEEWAHPTFPFVFYRWATDPQRFWGQGMVERGAGMQSDLNALTDVISQAYKVMVPQFWIDDSAGVQNDLNNVVGRVNRCKTDGGDIRTAVQVLSPDVGMGLLQRETEIAQRFMHVLGVDALAAKAEKPAGLNSGAALQNYKDSVAARFMPQGRRYEQTTVDLANLLFFFADKLSEEGHDQAVRVYGKGIGLEIIHYDDIRAQGDEVFEVRVQPASALPKDIAGRIQALFDLQALGVPGLDGPRMAQMIEMPDIEGITDEVNAPRDLVEQAIMQCYDLEDEQPQANAYWPREIAIAMLTNRIQQGLRKGTDPAVLDRMMALHTFVRGMPDPNAPPPPDPNAMTEGPPAMGGAPGAVPGPMPAAPPPGDMAPPPPPM